MENYLIATPNVENRKLITEFRYSDHELMTEKGRQKMMLKRDFAISALKKRVEDKLHFLQECPAYNRIRIGITNFYKGSSPQTDNFIRLLSCEGVKTP